MVRSSPWNATVRRVWIFGGVSGLLVLIVLAAPGCTRFGKKSLRASVSEPAPPPQPSGLPVGSAAPEIVGEDMDGVPFKLSDYRGQVVLLDFWGNW